MQSNNPTAPVATIELSDSERAVLIYEARRASAWSADRLPDAYPDDGTDAEALEIIRAGRDALVAAASVFAAAMSDEPLSATPAMHSALLELRGCVFRSCTVNGEWVVDPDFDTDFDPGLVEDREHFEMLGTIPDRVGDEMAS